MSKASDWALQGGLMLGANAAIVGDTDGAVQASIALLHSSQTLTSTVP